MPLASPAPSGWRGQGSSAPLPGWMLGFSSPGGCSFLQGVGLCGAPLAYPAPVPWDRAACALGAVAVLGCSAQHCGSTRKLWLFLYFFRVFFAFLAANLPLQVPWRKQNCAQGAASLPAPPHRGQSRAAAPGEGPWAGARPLPPLPNQIPSLEPAIWGTGPHAAPPGFSRGIGVGPQPERQRTGTAQCLCERIAAWDGAAGDGQGKTKNPPK